MNGALKSIERPNLRNAEILFERLEVFAMSIILCIRVKAGIAQAMRNANIFSCQISNTLRDNPRIRNIIWSALSDKLICAKIAKAEARDIRANGEISVPVCSKLLIVCKFFAIDKHFHVLMH